MRVASFNPITPLIPFICLTADAFTEQAKMFTSGLYFEINLANLPVSVNAMIRLMSFWSRTAEQTAAATASAVPTGPAVCNLIYHMFFCNSMSFPLRRF